MTLDKVLFELMVPFAKTVVPLEKVTLEAFPDDRVGEASVAEWLSVNVKTSDVRTGEAPEEVGVIVCTSVVVVTMIPAVTLRAVAEAEPDAANVDGEVV